MPAEAYSLEGNPLHEALKEKSKQLASPNFEGLRCVVVADAGSRMLRHPSESMRSPGTVTGNQVIAHFMGNADFAVDVVLALSPYRAPPVFGLQLTPLSWRSLLWVRTGLHLKSSGVTKLVALLPPPRFERLPSRVFATANCPPPRRTRSVPGNNDCIGNDWNDHQDLYPRLAGPSGWTHHT